MSTSTVSQFLKEKIQPQAQQLLKGHSAQTDKLRELLFSLKEDIEKQNERMLRLDVKSANVMVAKLAENLSATQWLLTELEKLDPAENTPKEQETIEKLTAALAELERKLTKNYGIAKTALDEANDVLDADDATFDSGEAKRWWAAAEAWIRRQQEDGKQRLDRIQKLREQGKKAVAERNAKVLSESQKTSTAIADAKPDLDEVKSGHAKFIAKYDEIASKLEKSQQDQLARDRETLDGLVRDFAATTAKIVTIDVEIQALELPPPDVAKAAALLKIPASHEAKLKKALESSGPEMIKALDALAKELGLKTSGKDMVAALKKAKLL